MASLVKNNDGASNQPRTPESIARSTILASAFSSGDTVTEGDSLQAGMGVCQDKTARVAGWLAAHAACRCSNSFHMRTLHARELSPSHVKGWMGSSRSRPSVRSCGSDPDGSTFHAPFGRVRVERSSALGCRHVALSPGPL